MTAPLPNEDHLDRVARAAAGDRAAWQSLVESRAGLVWSVIRQGRLSPESADDAFQEVFAAAVRALPDLKDHARFDAWLVTTARRTVWKAWSSRRSAPGELPEELRGADGRPEDLTQAQETRVLVQQGLEALSTRCRALLLAAFAQGPPPDYDHLAQQLGVPRGSLGPTRARCLEQLAKALAALGLGPNS